MAEKQEKSDLMIQLPWTVPPQPNVQTIVLQQPTKTHSSHLFELNNQIYMFYIGNTFGKYGFGLAKLKGTL